jgi:UDP-N-acetylmuramyl pentapeptide phosphotransferase/UDP-N-acetylglucosamine-1-phosphate transferase
VAQGIAVAVGLVILSETHDPLNGSVGAVTYGAMGIVWVWWVNVFNFMDGIDGIAGSEAAIIASGLVLLAIFGRPADPALAYLAATMTGAVIGFLIWNWSPARIFLGDVGSAPLGYLTGFLLLRVALEGHWKLALILPLYFLADATITLGRRLLRGERVWQAHREHFYQLAARGGLSHAAVVRRVIAADVMLIGCGWTAENGWATASLAASVAIVAALLAVLAHAR